MNAQKRQQIFARFQAANPHPTTELVFASPFELLIAVLLSAQATDVSVNKATARLFPVANTPQAILDLGLDGLTDYIKTIGLELHAVHLTNCWIIFDNCNLGHNYSLTWYACISDGKK